MSDPYMMIGSYDGSPLRRRERRLAVLSRWEWEWCNMYYGGKLL